MRNNVKKDCTAANLTLVEATQVAEDRRFWKTHGLPAHEDSVIVAQALSQVSKHNVTIELGAFYYRVVHGSILCDPIRPNPSAV